MLKASFLEYAIVQHLNVDSIYEITTDGKSAQILHKVGINIDPIIQLLSSYTRGEC